MTSITKPLISNHDPGGQLVVRNAGQEVTFDWSMSNRNRFDEPSVNWAAFYSDCEHEVLPVATGYRVTLTYNLYVTRKFEHIMMHRGAD